MSKKTKIKILLLLAVLVVSTGFRCKCVSSADKKLLQPVVLTYWRVWDNESSMKEIINKYRALHPNISIDYRKLRYEEFEQALLEAYAQDKPPDIISLHSSWLKKYALENKFISSMPKEVKVAYQYEKVALKMKKEVIIEVITQALPSIGQIKDDFIDVVGERVIIDDKIYGLPLGVDTLVMYYNRDLLDAAGIAQPATDWQTFQDHVKRLTFQNSEGTLVQSGTALGTAENVRRATDILSLLMMQNGTEMMTGPNVTFNLVPANLADKSYTPGIEALKFYTDFANSVKEVYSWNGKMPDSLTAFARGQLAYYFGYSYDLPEIMAASLGKINLGISKMPQIKDSREVNFANFWVETVSSRSKNSDLAWDFINFATGAKNVTSYLDAAKKPTAIRSLIETQLQTDDLKMFASQLLTAKDWYSGYDSGEAEKGIKDLISAVLAGDKPEIAIGLAAGRVQQTMSPKRTSY